VVKREVGKSDWCEGCIVTSFSCSPLFSPLFSPLGPVGFVHPGGLVGGERKRVGVGVCLFFFFFFFSSCLPFYHGFPFDRPFLLFLCPFLARFLSPFCPGTNQGRAPSRRFVPGQNCSLFNEISTHKKKKKLNFLVPGQIETRINLVENKYK